MGIVLTNFGPHVRWTHFLLATILSVSLTPRLDATSAFALIDFERGLIVLAADGLTTGRGGMRSAKDCKIFQVGECYFMTAGPTFIQNRNLVFDADQTAKRVCGPGPVEAIADAWERIVEAEARIVFAEAVRENWLNKLILTGREFTRVEAIFVNGGTHTEVSVRTVHFSRDGVKAFPGRNGSRVNGTPRLFVSIGARGAIDGLLQRNPLFVREEGFERAAKRFLELEIEANPKSVGPPMSILEISYSGTRWLEQGGCPAIQPPVRPAH